MDKRIREHAPKCLHSPGLSSCVVNKEEVQLTFEKGIESSVHQTNLHYGHHVHFMTNSTSHYSEPEVIGKLT